jgi:hypothetical protein
MIKFVELRREKDYYRHGVWKIFYRLADVDYIRVIERADGTKFDSDRGSDEIKFSGIDAEQRSLSVFEAMQAEE